MPSLCRLAALFAIAFALCACGITGNYRNDPGFADITSPGYRDTHRQFGISLGRLPIGIASILAPRFIDDEPELTGLLRSLRGVRVYIYAIDGDVTRVQTHIDDTRHELVAEGWDQVVVVRDDGGLVDALVSIDERDTVRGMVVMFQDDEDLVLVNLIGRIEPEIFTTYMAELGIVAPDMAFASL